MKRLILFVVIAVSITACSCQRNLAERYNAQEELINKYEELLDSIYSADRNTFLDVYMETDVYYEYTVLKYKCDSLNGKQITD